MSGVDVLAVMDEFVLAVGDEFGNEPALRLREARAAVAELIQAVGDVYDADTGMPCPGPCPSCRIRAALDRVGGAA